MKTLGEWARGRPLTRAQAVGWMVRLAKGLLVLHELDVAHGRVNRNCVTAATRNPAGVGVILDEDEVERDFHFYSLERIERSGKSKDDDVWALGVLFYHLLTGGYPFPGERRVKVGERIKWAPPSPVVVYGVDDEDLQRLLDRIFKQDESLRLASLPLLVDALVALDPAADALPPLELGVESGDPDAEDPPGLDDLPSLDAPTVDDDEGRPTIEDIDDAPTVARDVAPPVAEPKPKPKPEPKAEPKPKAEPEPKAEPKPRAEPPPRATEPTAPLPLVQPAKDQPPKIPVKAKASTEEKAPVKRKPEPAKTSLSSWLWVVVGVLVGVAAVVYLQRFL